MWQDERTGKALLEAARTFNKKGIVGGSGSALQEMEAFEKLIERQKRLLKKEGDEVPLSQKRQLKEEIKELERARIAMQNAAERQALLASAALAEKPRVRGEDGILDIDGAIMKIFEEAQSSGCRLDVECHNTGRGIARVHKDYEGGHIVQLSSVSVSCDYK